MTTDASTYVTTQLMNGPVFWFSGWPHTDVELPRTGVYTIWNREDNFIYVGIAGTRPDGGKAGLRGRLHSHASGRLSGDQFCCYVLARLVLTGLHNRLNEIAAGSLSLDTETRAYVRENLGFRFASMPCGVSAAELERRIQRGEFGVRPLLNGRAPVLPDGGRTPRAAASPDLVVIRHSAVSSRSCQPARATRSTRNRKPSRHVSWHGACMANGACVATRPLRQITRRCYSRRSCHRERSAFQR